MGLVPGRVTEDSPGYQLEFGDFRLRAWTPTLRDAPGGEVEVGVRAEDVIADVGGVAVNTGRGYYLGSHGFVQIELAPGHLVEMRTDSVPPPPGERVRIRLRRLHIFHPTTGSVLGRIEDGAI